MSRIIQKWAAQHVESWLTACYPAVGSPMAGTLRIDIHAQGSLKNPMLQLFHLKKVMNELY